MRGQRERRPRRRRARSCPAGCAGGRGSHPPGAAHRPAVASRNAVTASGTGTRRLRWPLGSARKRAATFSRTIPGTSHDRRAVVELVEQRQRHRQREAVLRVAGGEPVLERQLHARHRQPLREERLGHVGGGVPHQDLAGQVQPRRIVLLGRLAPALEGGQGADLRRHPLGIERRDRLLVDQHVLPPRLVLEFRHLGDQPPVVLDEPRRAWPGRRWRAPRAGTPVARAADRCGRTRRAGAAPA